MENKYLNTAKDVAESLGYTLVEFYVDEKYKKVNIIIYKKTGITIKDCEIMTHSLLQNIEFNDRFRNDYDIVVSSPGVNREFKSFEEYKIFEGKEVQIITDNAQHPIITGILKGVEEQNILIEEGIKIHKIPYMHIKKGGLFFDFKF